MEGKTKERLLLAIILIMAAVIGGGIGFILGMIVTAGSC